MTEFSVKVEGLDKVQRMLNKADAKKALVVGLVWGTNKLKNEVAEYPPPTDANYPRTRSDTGQVMRWYERGYGTRWLRADGSIGGRMTSHPLSKGWKTKVYRSGHIRGEVSNVAKYAGYVQGSKELQARVMDEIGWKRLPEEGQKLAPKVTQEIIRAFKETMK